MEIQIHHAGCRDGAPVFEVIRSSDTRHTEAIPLPHPAAFPVEGYPAKQLLPELRWYLEEYLQAPFGAFPQLAEHVAQAMQAWGAAVFDALFTGNARDWYQDARRQNFEGFRIKIASDSPEIMSWPWEALHSRDDGYLALRCCIDRQLSRIADPPPPTALPQDAIHILYVISRPYGESDVGYHILAGSLVDFIRENRLPVTVDVLRPPTFDQLRRVLDDHPGYYHMVHFDGHGGYSTAAPVPARDIYAAPEGQLVFETKDGAPDPVDARTLAQLLARFKIPFVVMNACRSGMIDGQAQNPFASVAAGLLKAGVRSVVAMGYSLYVSGAKQFVPAFYERLFSTGQVSEAMRAGREMMLRRPERDCIMGKLPLQDWVVPVSYQQPSAESAILPRIRPGGDADGATSILPEDAKVDGDYGFIGRGRDIQELERAIQRQRQAAILIHGQAGIGKTSLAKGFLRWLERTGGLWERVFWFNFQEIHSMEYVVNRLIGSLAGDPHMARPMEEKLSALVQRLRSTPCLLVWDNFESASGIEGTEIQPQLSAEDRASLAQLLKELRGSGTKVLITSRSEEAWLNVQCCYRLPLDGLAGEDLWEYCNAVVGDLGLKVDRTDETYVQIMEKLCGNPLAIRAILLRLQDCSARRLLAELEGSFEGLMGDESTRRLQAAYTVFGGELVERYLPVLQMVGLHEYYLDADQVKAMLGSAGCTVEPDAVDRCCRILENAGFCTHIGLNFYRLHPALRGYLLRQTPAPEPVQKGFVDIMGHVADHLVREPLHKIKVGYQINIANFYYARRLAETHKMDDHYEALTQSLAHYAEEMRWFEEANKLYAALAEKENSCGDWDSLAVVFHQLGITAQKQRDLATAEVWYRKSLAIKEKRGNECGAAATYHHLGLLAQKRREFATAEAWYKKALEIKERRGDERGAASTYHQLGVVAGEQRDHAAAEAWCKKALEIEEKLRDEYGKSMTYHQLGIIAQEQREFAAAEAWYKRALKIEKKQNNEDGAAMTYHHLGRTAEEQRDYAVAESWYKKALEIKEKRGDEHGAADTYHQLGVIAQQQQDHMAAEAWYKKAMEIKERQGDEHGAAITYHQLGAIAREQQDHAAAEAWCKKAMEIFENQKDGYNAAIVYHQLGIIAQEQHDHGTAKAWYKKALKIKEKQGDEYGTAMTYYQLGRLTQEQRDFMGAAEFYLKALKVFIGTNDPHSAGIAIRSYADLLHDAEDPERSRLREAWSACMDREQTKILEQMEEGSYGTDS